MNCLMCGKPVKWFERPYDGWLHENRTIYCAGKASVATPDDGAAK